MEVGREMRPKSGRNVDLLGIENGESDVSERWLVVFLGWLLRW